MHFVMNTFFTSLRLSLRLRNAAVATTLLLAGSATVVQAQQVSPQMRFLSQMTEMEALLSRGNTTDAQNLLTAALESMTTQYAKLKAEGSPKTMDAQKLYSEVAALKGDLVKNQKKIVDNMKSFVAMY